MAKIIAVAVLLGIIALDAVLGWYHPRAGITANGIVLAASIAAIFYVFLPRRGNGMENSYGAALLMLLAAAVVAGLIAGAGLGWSLWVLYR